MMMNKTLSYLPLHGSSFRYTCMEYGSFYGLSSDCFVRIRDGQRKEISLNVAGEIINTHFNVVSASSDSSEEFYVSFLASSDNGGPCVVYEIKNWEVSSRPLVECEEDIRFYHQIDVFSAACIGESEQIYYMHHSTGAFHSLSSEGIFSRFLGPKDKSIIVSMVSSCIRGFDYLFCLCANLEIKVFSICKRSCIKSFSLPGTSNNGEFSSSNISPSYLKTMPRLVSILPQSDNESSVCLVIFNFMLSKIQNIQLKLDASSVHYLSTVFDLPLPRIANVIDMKISGWEDYVGQEAKIKYMLSILNFDTANKFTLMQFNLALLTESPPKMEYLGRETYKIHEDWWQRIHKLRDSLKISRASDPETYFLKFLQDSLLFSDESIEAAVVEFRKLYSLDHSEIVGGDRNRNTFEIICRMIDTVSHQRAVELGSSESLAADGILEAWMEFLNLVTFFEIERLKPRSVSHGDGPKVFIAHSSGISMILHSTLANDIYLSFSKDSPLSLSKSSDSVAIDSLSFLYEAMKLIYRIVPKEILSEGIQRYAFEMVKSDHQSLETAFIFDELDALSEGEFSSLKHSISHLHDFVINSGALESLIRICVAPCQGIVDRDTCFSRSFNQIQLLKELRYRLEMLTLLFNYCLSVRYLSLWKPLDDKLLPLLQDAFLLYQNLKLLCELMWTCGGGGKKALQLADDMKSMNISDSNFRSFSFMKHSHIYNFLLSKNTDFVSSTENFLKNGTDSVIDFLTWLMFSCNESKLASEILHSYRFENQSLLLMYLKGYSFLKIGRYARGRYMMERILSVAEEIEGGFSEFVSFLEDCHPNLFDREFPMKDQYKSLFFIDHLVKLFTFSKSFESSIFFGRMGIIQCEAIKNDLHKSQMRNVFLPVLYLHCLELKHYDSAFSLLCSFEDNERKRDLLRILVTSLCDELTSEWDQSYYFDLLFQKLPYANLEKDFVEIFVTKAKNSNVKELLQKDGEIVQLNFFKLLHSFFIFRGDFRNAASIMFWYAHRLWDSRIDLDHCEALYVEIAQSYLIVSQNLNMLDPKNRWIVDREDKKCISYMEVMKKYKLTLAYLSLLQNRKSPINVDPDSVSDIVSLLLDAEMYETAISLLQLHGLDLSPVFNHLSLRCVFSGSKDFSAGNAGKEHLIINSDGSFEGGLQGKPEKYWLLLKKLLERHDDKRQDKYRLCCIDYILSLRGSCQMPSFLISDIKHRRLEEVTRILIKRGRIAEAKEHGREYIKLFLSAKKDGFSFYSIDLVEKLMVIDSELHEMCSKFFTTAAAK